ncbi:MAG: hypothetical protein J6568_02150 [Snodgrassella sp.]|nr:hypothetical protein [Snodgrassella sp.]
MFSGKKLGEAIDVAIKLKGVRKAEVARAFSIKPPSVTSWIKTGRVNKTHIDKLISYFADVVAPEHFGISSVEPVSNHYCNVKIPLLSWEEAGDWQETDDTLPKDRYIHVPAYHKPSDKTFVLKVLGDSMEPEFVSSDYIIIEPDLEPQDKNFIIVYENEAEAMLKQLIIEGSRQYLKPLNPRYPIIAMTNQFKICGVVIEKFKIYT